MARAAVLLAGALAAAAALAVAAALLSSPGAPPPAAGPQDVLRIEYTVRAEGGGPLPAGGSALVVWGGGEASYSESAPGAEPALYAGRLSGERMARLAALVGETGFASIPPGSLPAAGGGAPGAAHEVRVLLGGAESRLAWEGGAPLPPIVSEVRDELEAAAAELRGGG